MDPTLERLIRLQEVSLGVEDLGRKLAAMPGRAQVLDQSLARHRADVAKSKDELAGLQKDRRKLEGDLQTVEAKIGKYQAQLMEVKTNKEYTAMLHEIEAAKGERSEAETRILQSMDLADTLAIAIRAKETALAEEQTRVAGELAALKSEEADLAARKSALETEQRRVEAEMPADLVAEFTRIARGRGGLVVVRVVDGMCQGCLVRIQPRIYQQVRRDEGILRCDSCKRFIYYIEEKRAEPPAGA